jgi:hypothetical protein
MSNWLDTPNATNKLKSSYVSGFMDVSGSGISIRQGSLAIYDGSGSNIPNFTIDATDMHIYDGRTVTDVSNAKLVHLKDVSENIQTRLTDITERTQFITSSPSSDVSGTPITSISGDIIIGGNLWTHYPANSIPQSAISGGVGGIYIPTEVTTFDDDEFAIIKNFEQGQTIIDASVNGNLSVSGTANLNSPLYVNSGAYFYGDVSMVGNLMLNGNVSVPTQPLADSSTKIATTEYVQNTLFRQFTV